MASRELSKVLNAQLKVSKLTNSQRTQLKDKQTSVLVSLGKTINMIISPVTNLIKPIRIPRPINNPEDIIGFPKLDFGRLKSISQRADNLYSGFNPGILVNRKIKSLTRLPLTFKKALPVALYGLLNSRSKISVLAPDNRRLSKSTLERQTKVTQDYFSRNRSRVTLRYDNNKKIFYLIKK